METHINFISEKNVLEGLLYRSSGEKGVIITHPHSLYGGEMNNPVVASLQRAYSKHRFSTFRFNFRGVGGSTGEFANGCGEEKDVLAALDFLIKSGCSDIHLAGYSFGARVLAGIKTLPEVVSSQLYIAPPVSFMDFSGISGVTGLKLIVAGEYDDIGPPAAIEQQMREWNSDVELTVIHEADHFFGGELAQLESIVSAFVASE